jgi:hypothetical protein
MQSQIIVQMAKKDFKGGISTLIKRTDDTPAENTGKIAEQPVASLAISTTDIRTTLVMGEDYLEWMKDYVYSRKVKGDFRFTQKEALHEAIDLLKKKVGKLPPRPDSEREAENKFKQQIKKGRSK